MDSAGVALRNWRICSSVRQTLRLKIRANARERLEAKFDIRACHHAGLTAAPMPMSVLEQVMDEWARSQSA